MCFFCVSKFVFHGGRYSGLMSQEKVCSVEMKSMCPINGHTKMNPEAGISRHIEACFNYNFVARAGPIFSGSASLRIDLEASVSWKFAISSDFGYNCVNNIFFVAILPQKSCIEGGLAEFFGREAVFEPFGSGRLCRALDLPRALLDRSLV